jgi:hypothetical protein
MPGGAEIAPTRVQQNSMDITVRINIMKSNDYFSRIPDGYGSAISKRMLFHTEAF